MPKKQSTAAKKARAAARERGTKFTIALREAIADGPAPEFAAAARVTITQPATAPAGQAGRSWRVQALAGDGAPLAEWPVDLPTADFGHLDRWLAHHAVRRADEWPEGPMADGAAVAVRRADSPAAALAFVEAHFVPADPDQPCRCAGRGSDGPCHHGTLCGDDGPDGEAEPCQGRLIHLDRYPGSMWGVTTWEDVYQCSATGEQFTGETTLPDLPWGCTEPQGHGQATATIIFDGVRHPGFPDEADGAGGDWGCGECGASGGPGYRCNCPPVCEECGGDLNSGYGCDCDEPYDTDQSERQGGGEGQGDAADDEDRRADEAIQAWKDGQAMGYIDRDGTPIEPDYEPDYEDQR